MRKIMLWMVAFVVLVLLVGLIVQAKSYGEAYALQHRAHLQLAAWETNRFYAIDNALWKKHESAMQHALSVMPNNAAFMNTLALLYQVQAFHLGSNSLHRATDMLKASEYFRQATVASPAWGYSWMNLAYHKYRANQIDAEYGDALLRAMQLAPWEEDNMAWLIELGMNTHDMLLPEQKKLVEVYVMRVATAKGVWLARRLQLSKSWDSMCEKIVSAQDSAVYKQICPQ